jgi:hypothetical protein
MPSAGDELVVTISSNSNVESGVAHPWGSNEHVHIRKDEKTLQPGDKCKIKLNSYTGDYWVGDVIKEIDVTGGFGDISRNSQTMTVYWVITSKSYCYHKRANCKRLNKHAGDRVSAEINRDSGDIPEPVKKRRPCPDCI